MGLTENDMSVSEAHMLTSAEMLLKAWGVELAFSLYFFLVCLFVSLYLNIHCILF